MNNWVDSKTLAMGTGVASGVGLTAYTTGMLTATAYGLSAPVIVGGILGLLPTQYLAVPLHRKYGSILRNSRNLETFCHFTIRATTAMLGAWIGLAATSFLFHLTINPFTLPALITAGISASIILGLYLYAYSHERAMRNQVSIAQSKLHGSQRSSIEKTKFRGHGSRAEHGVVAAASGRYSRSTKRRFPEDSGSGDELHATQGNHTGSNTLEGMDTFPVQQGGIRHMQSRYPTHSVAGAGDTLGSQNIGLSRRAVYGTSSMMTVYPEGSTNLDLLQGHDENSGLEAEYGSSTELHATQGNHTDTDAEERFFGGTVPVQQGGRHIQSRYPTHSVAGVSGAFGLQNTGQSWGAAAYSMSSMMTTYPEGSANLQLFQGDDVVDTSNATHISSTPVVPRGANAQKKRSENTAMRTSQRDQYPILVTTDTHLPFAAEVAGERDDENRELLAAGQQQQLQKPLRRASDEAPANVGGVRGLGKTVSPQTLRHPTGVSTSARPSQIGFLSTSSANVRKNPNKVAIYFRAEDAVLSGLRERFTPEISATTDDVYVMYVSKAYLDEYRKQLKAVAGVVLDDSYQEHQNAHGLVS